MTAEDNLGRQWPRHVENFGGEPLPGEHVSEGWLPTKALKAGHDIRSSLIWNPKEQQRLSADIKENGIKSPLTVSFGQRGPTEKPHYILNDGNHRLDVAKKRKISHVPVRVYHRTDPGGSELPGFEGR